MLSRPQISILLHYIIKLFKNPSTGHVFFSNLFLKNCLSKAVKLVVYFFKYLNTFLNLYYPQT